MKEAKQSPYKGLIFRETFRDEQSVRRNGGTPTDVDFSNGVGSFNGISSNIQYQQKDYGSSLSIRVRVTINDVISTQGFLGSIIVSTGNYEFIGVASGKFVISTESYTIVDTSSAYSPGEYEVMFVIENGSQVIYVNGESAGTGTWSVSKFELGEVGRFWSNNNYAFDGDLDLVEIYNRALTPSEVANLYNNTWNKEVRGANRTYSEKMLYSDGNLVLYFDDLSTLTIARYVGTSTPSINGDTIELTEGYIEYIELSNGNEFYFNN